MGQGDRKTWRTTCVALAACLLGAAGAVRADETWTLGDLVEVPGGGAAPDETDDPASMDGGRPPRTRPVAPPPGPLPDLGLPPDAGPDEYLAEFLRRCGAPTLEETMNAAVAFAGLDDDVEASLVEQARWAALLPRVRLSVRRDWEHDESLDVQPDPTDGRFGIDTDDDLELGFSAQWDLAALAAPPAATTARRLALEAAAARRALRLEVAATYFERCRLRLEWLGATDDVRRAETAWAIAERTARLDALTGGFFRRQAEAPTAEAREGR
ncbi:MAG: hypothetical protein GYA57_21985 [Myxococcales bacterium]|nr:hypothetical protein [Myxococcales bacterium]